jgi:hypothetical protein
MEKIELRTAQDLEDALSRGATHPDDAKAFATRALVHLKIGWVTLEPGVREVLDRIIAK